MLTRVDRVQLVVSDRTRAESSFGTLLGAALVRKDVVRPLAALRSVLRVGRSEVELLEPDGAGAAAEFLRRTRGGLFAAGFSARDPEALRSHLAKRGVDVAEAGGQLFVHPDALRVPGLWVVISAEAELEPAGLLDRLYEVTLLSPDWKRSAEQVAEGFALDSRHFVSIRSTEYGYEGLLTLFHPTRLDRIEVVTPFDAAKTMGRFFERRGPSLYMCYAESGDTAALRAAWLEFAPQHWTGPLEGAMPDNLFLHPTALSGLLLGVSRRTFAWTWSGSPERVEPSP
ncbi:MAG TPA: VOC family protein [Myxococcota bacterium]|nr:VOC family protein [Myxococcota bacterium]